MPGIPDGLKGVVTFRLRTASLGYTVVLLDLLMYVLVFGSLNKAPLRHPD